MKFSVKKRKKATKIFFLIVIGVLVLATCAYLFFTRTVTNNYNGYVFTKGNCPGTTTSCWFVQFSIKGQPYTISFYNHPKDLSDVAIDPAAIYYVNQFAQQKNGTVYIGVPQEADGEVGIASVAVARILGSRYNIYNYKVKGAVEGTGTGQVSCNNAVPDQLIILYEQGKINAVGAQAQNCIIITGTDAPNVLRVSEAYTYYLLRIMQFDQAANNATTTK